MTKAARSRITSLSLAFLTLLATSPLSAGPRTPGTVAVDDVTHTFDVATCGDPQRRGAQFRVQGTGDDGTELTVVLTGPAEPPWATQRISVSMNNIGAGTSLNLGATYAVDADGNWRIARPAGSAAGPFFQADGSTITAAGMLMNGATGEMHSIEISVECPD